ncbi:MAG: NAD(P)-binding protein [Zoogloeaceae bacterium]|nr:NAD(P)-binding protein [Zoogloeaceae bacterium]
MDRRHFITGLGAVAGSTLLPACSPKAGKPIPPGRLLGSSLTLGHRLRSGAFPEPSETRRLPVVIIGAGIGGLSAGWKLKRAGFEDFLLLEMESEAGGNSRAGKNAVSAYPLGAHYLPLPTREAVATRELLAELGVLKGDPRAPRPEYEERYLCATPQERLYRNGLWQEGLFPQMGVAADDLAQYAAFQERMADFRQRRDSDGRRAFALPMALSSRSPDLLALDNTSMRDWLLAQGWDSAHLHWYVNYACRDDYGCSSDAVSAWAGIHYFACRDGEAANAETDTVLTTPGGNAWLADGLAQGLDERILPNALVYRVADTGRAVEIDLFLPQEARSIRLLAGQAIWAAPLFLVPGILAGNPMLQQAAQKYSYAPWLVANLTLKAFPEERAGTGVAWDNVLHDSPGLGYVVATHQQMRLRRGPTVLTYYRALSELSPTDARKRLEQTSREQWAADILDDLARPHPDIREQVTSIDIVRYGHAMARPIPGFIWGGARSPFAADEPRLRFAHADVSGFSLFEEAQYRGVLAAERTLDRLRIPYASSLS